MTFDNSASKLTSNGVSPVTVMFSDRPERIAANMRAAEFVPFWSKGKDSFLSDPPNADISILGRRPASANRGGAARPDAAGRQPDLHGQGAAARDADHAIRVSVFIELAVPQGASPQNFR
jgi:hypothetical protein